jgi:hypothetical protein
MGRKIYIFFLLSSILAAIWVLWDQGNLSFLIASLLELWVWGIIITVVLSIHFFVHHFFKTLEIENNIDKFDTVWVRNFLIIFLLGLDVGILIKYELIVIPDSFNLFKFILVCSILSITHSLYLKLASPTEKFFLGIRKVDDD